MSLSISEKSFIIDVWKGSRSQMFFKINLLKNFANFACVGVSLCLKAYNFIKKRLQHRCFPPKFAKFLGTPIFYRTTTVAASVGSYIRL